MKPQKYVGIPHYHLAPMIVLVITELSSPFIYFRRSNNLSELFICEAETSGVPDSPAHPSCSACKHLFGPPHRDVNDLNGSFLDKLQLHNSVICGLVSAGPRQHLKDKDNDIEA